MAIPLAGRFVGEVDEDSVSQTRYFESKRQSDKVQSSLRAAEKAGDAAEYRKILKEHPEVVMYQDIQRTQRSISELNRLAVETIGKPERLQQIDKQRAAEMRALNESLRRMEKREPRWLTAARVVTLGPSHAEPVSGKRPGAKQAERAAHRSIPYRPPQRLGAGYEVDLSGTQSERDGNQRSGAKGGGRPGPPVPQVSSDCQGGQHVKD